MGALTFLTSMGLAPAVKPAEPPPLPAPIHGRFFGLHDELQAKFPGCEVRTQYWHSGNYITLEAEIKGKRPDGTRVTFKVEAKREKTEAEPEHLARLFKEIDSWA